MSVLLIQMFGMDPYSVLMNNAGIITSDLPIRTGRSYCCLAEDIEFCWLFEIVLYLIMVYCDV